MLETAIRRTFVFLLLSVLGTATIEFSAEGNAFGNLQSSGTTAVLD